MDMETKAPWYLLGLDRVGLINDIYATYCAQS